MYLDSDFRLGFYIKIVYLDSDFRLGFYKTGYTITPLMALGFNKFLGNQGANFNCHPSNIVVNCISIYIMVILDNSRTLGAFERQSRILHN